MEKAQKKQSTAVRTDFLQKFFSYLVVKLDLQKKISIRISVTMEKNWITLWMEEIVLVQSVNINEFQH